MTRQIGWGILSTANIGKGDVIPAIQKSNNGKLVAVASRDLTRAQAFAQETDIPKAYGSYDELLADSDVEAIYNPLPNSLHAPWSIQCAEAGKPTLCEKPLAIDANEARQMAEAFKKHDVPLAEAFMYRFHPQTERVKQLIDQGAIGEIKVIQSTFSFNIRSEENIRLSKPLAGGSLMDIGCYCVNIMRHLIGEEPDSVQSMARIGEGSQVDEVMTGLLSFPSGVLGHFDCSFRAPFTNTYELRGSQGRILVEHAFRIPKNEETTIRFWHDDTYEAIVIPPVDEYVPMVEDFADALLNNRPPRYGVADAIANMELIDRLYAAAGMK